MCLIHCSNVAVLDRSHNNYAIVYRMTTEFKPTDDRLLPNSHCPARLIASDLATGFATAVSGCWSLLNHLLRDCKFLVVVLLAWFRAVLQSYLLQHGVANSSCNFQLSTLCCHGVFVCCECTFIGLPVLAALSLDCGLSLSCVQLIWKHYLVLIACLLADYGVQNNNACAL
jgi:hypothetical protein